MSATLTCHAPHPQLERRGSECGTVLVVGQEMPGDLTPVGVARNQPEQPLQGLVYIRCSRRSCGFWNIFATRVAMDRAG